jgi:hypothetical protein
MLARWQTSRLPQGCCALDKYTILLYSATVIGALGKEGGDNSAPSTVAAPSESVE